MSSRRRSLLPSLTALAAALLPLWAGAQNIGLSAAQTVRVRAQKVPGAIRLLPRDFKFATPGTLTVGVLSGYFPFAVVGPDDKTFVGCDPDLAQLIADSLGLKLELVNVAWEDWPLAVASGRFDAALTNVTVTEERKQKFDFSTYRRDVLAFYVVKSSPIQHIREPKDVAGLKVAVGPSTNQEQILLRWSRLDVAAGLKPVQPMYYDDDAVRRLAMESGRIDAFFGPNAEAAYESAQWGTTRLVGLVPGGWPRTADIAVVTRKGSGLAQAITYALNAQIKNGNYGKVLALWHLSSEAIDVSRTNPPGLPAS